MAASARGAGPRRSSGATPARGGAGATATRESGDAGRSPAGVLQRARRRPRGGGTQSGKCGPGRRAAATRRDGRTGAAQWIPVIGAEPRSRLRARDRLDVLLDEVQGDLSRRERQPDGGESRARRRRGSPARRARRAARPRQMRRTPAAARSSRSFSARQARARRSAKTALSTSEHAGHREHVGVHRVGHRPDDAGRSPDPEVLERVGDEEADQRQQDTA